jgi:hypothetical protein
MKCRDCPDEARFDRTRCEKHLAHYREYSRKNMEHIWAASLMRKYGIDSDRYWEMHEGQGGLCAVCMEPETNKPGRGDTVARLSVDHCHETGRVRGLLCFRCNTMLGKINDDSEMLRRAADYLDFGLFS